MWRHERNRATAADGAPREKCLTFRLADEVYGLEILKVQEIIGMMPSRACRGRPPSCAGVINLRGRVIPVVDLRLRFGMPRGRGHRA